MQRLVPANETKKGKRTWNWNMPDGKQITIYQRYRDEEFGNHFHKGGDPSKNPERFLLLNGIVYFWLEDKNGHRYTMVLDATDGPVEIMIRPYILHGARALADCCFIEYRQSKFDPAHTDTYPEEIFRETH